MDDLGNAQGHGSINTFSMTILRTKPVVSLRPSGLAESPLLLIGLGLRLIVAEPEVRFARVDDFRRCGMIRTMFNCRRTKVAGKTSWGATCAVCGFVQELVAGMAMGGSR